MKFKVQGSTFKVGRSLLPHSHTPILPYLLLLVLVLVAGAAFAQDNPTTEKMSGGWINWEKQMIKAVGHGVLPGDADNPAQAKLMARQAAIADAYRNMASVAKGVRVTGQTCVKNFMTESDEVRLQVDGFIRGAEIVSEKQLEDRSYEVILQAPLTVVDGLVSDLKGELLIANPDTSGPVGDVTGLLIDARGLGIQPAMSPKIYDEDGAEVYGTVHCSPDFAIETGIAGYPRSMDYALKSDRVGAHPLIVKALSKGPKFATDVVISNADAARIKSAAASSNFLPRCRVAILLGPAK
jgi:hypothetical protein